LLWETGMGRSGPVLRGGQILKVKRSSFCGLIDRFKMVNGELEMENVLVHRCVVRSSSFDHPLFLELQH